jgi:hypothetical protein
LGHFVSLKFLPEDVAQDAQTLGTASARSARSFGCKPSNICTIYEIGEGGRSSFIAREFMERNRLNY